MDEEKRINHQSVKDTFADALLEAANPPDAVFVEEFPCMMESMGGFRMNELTLLCAATGAGKSAMIANLAAHLTWMNIPHYVASVETGKNDFIRRVVSVMADENINKGEQIDREKILFLINSYKRFMSENIRYAVYENRVSVQELLFNIEDAWRRFNCKMFFLDNLNFFLEVRPDNYEKAEMDNAIHELVMLTKKIPIHIFLIVHPRKTNNGLVESEFDIKGSATAVQECSNVILFNRMSKDELKMSSWLRFSDRKMTFKKIRKRGMYVGKEILFKFTESGAYVESGWWEESRSG